MKEETLIRATLFVAGATLGSIAMYAATEYVYARASEPQTYRILLAASAGAKPDNTPCFVDPSKAKPGAILPCLDAGILHEIPIERVR